jgi:hypothetical protein
MSYVRRVQAALAARPGEKLFGHQVAVLAGLPNRVFQRHAAVLVKDNRISRTKSGEGRLAYYRYWLTDEQHHHYQRRVERFPESFNMVTDTEDVPDRLSFLRMLKENTVFAEHAALALIIGNYERTLKLRRAIAEQDE